jgi:hypothetical protein
MNDKQHPSKDEINELINHKVTEAKLEVAERRLHFALWFGGAVIAVFGVLLPLMQNSISSRDISSAIEKTELRSSEASTEVSKAIEKMEREFAELAGKQILKPEIACSANGVPLENSILTFTKNNNRHTISVRNTGNSVATLIRMRLYLNVRDQNLEQDFLYGGHQSWHYAEYNDKPSYKYMLQGFFRGGDDFIAAGDALSVSFVMERLTQSNEMIESPALLVIYYGAAEPKEIPFTFRAEGAGTQKQTP